MPLNWLLGSIVLTKWPVFESQCFFRRKITKNSFRFWSAYFEVQKRCSASWPGSGSIASIQHRYKLAASADRDNTLANRTRTSICLNPGGSSQRQLFLGGSQFFTPHFGFGVWRRSVISKFGAGAQISNSNTCICLPLLSQAVLSAAFKTNYTWSVVRFFQRITGDFVVKMSNSD